MMMKERGLRSRRSFVAAGLAAAWAGCASNPPPAAALAILVIGNSLVYTGNLPAVFDTLSASNGRRTRTNMLVKGGARLADRVQDGSAIVSLDRLRPGVVVMQEHSGALIGAFGDTSRAESAGAIGYLAQEARQRSAKPVLLGGYQQDATASQALLAAEEAVAQRWLIAHVRLSAAFLAGLVSAPERAWLEPDFRHPGADLTLLQAVLLYHTLFDAWPEARALNITAPIYPTDAAFHPPRLAHETPALPAWAVQRSYNLAAVQAVITIARRDGAQPTATALISRRPSSSSRD